MKSVGQMLREAREKKKFAVGDIHKFIKIHPKFIQALEEDNYSVFSDKIHAKGFLKIYAEFLGLDVEQLSAFWRREHEAAFDKKRQKKKLGPSLSKPAKIILTPQLITGVLVSILVVGFFIYLFVQYKSYSGAPALEIYTPQSNIIVHSDVLDITGKTDQDCVLLINSQRVILNPDGSFATSLRLNEGINTLSFMAVNRLGKETEKICTIIYRPQEPVVAGDKAQETTGSNKGE